MTRLSDSIALGSMIRVTRSRLNISSTTETLMSTQIAHLQIPQIPDGKLAREVTELVRDTESPLLFHHSTRVYFFGALAGIRKRLKFDRELLYVGAMFHDMGLTEKYRSATERFEVDSANAAREFLRQQGIDEAAVEIVWDAIAL